MKITGNSNKSSLSIPSSAPSFVTAAGYERCVGHVLVAANEGGVRAIYYWAPARKILLMLLIYGKNEQDDLTPDQLRTLKSLVEKEFK